MVTIKEQTISESVMVEDAAKSWAKFTPRQVVVARFMPKGGEVDGVTIQPGHYALLRDDGKVVDIEPVMFEAVFAPA